MFEAILAAITALANMIAGFAPNDDQKAANSKIKEAKAKIREFNKLIREDVKFLAHHKTVNTWTYVENKYPELTEEQKKARVQLLTDLL